MIRVAIADDHRLLLEGLANALSAVSDLSVVATAVDGNELLERLEGANAQVLVIDIEMPGMDGFAALEQLAGSLPAVIVTMHADEERRQRAAQLGASAFLSKGAPLPELAAAVRAVLAGENLIESGVDEGVMARHGAPVLDAGAAALTAREIELLTMLGRGVSTTDELAERLFISSKTVKNHLASIYEKLGIADRAQAAVEAIRLGFTGD
ncbi:MAG: response regulator transcription factor [Acidimicrobiia bacterium]|nr:response regulator transcription factor [Acidimicrobiia bacterium]